MTYTYDDAGRLQTRTWARDVTTTYGYNEFGELASVMHDDNGTTPDVTFTYDRLGRQTNVTDGTGTHEFNYAPDGDNPLEDDNPLSLDSETISGSANGYTDRMIARLYESATNSTHIKGRPSGFTMGDYSVGYGYDTAGRMNGVNWEAGIGTEDAATYSYYVISDPATGDLVHTDFLSGYSTPGLEVTYSYEAHRNLKTGVTNTAGVWRYVLRGSGKSNAAVDAALGL